MKKRLFSAAVIAVVLSTSLHAGVELPSYEDPKYTRDWYAPPPDWVPVTKTGQFVGNTRIPEIVWVEYKGSYGPGLHIAPVPQDILAKLRDYPGEHLDLCNCPDALVPLQAETDPGKTESRTVRVQQLDLKDEWASSFTNFSFRVRSDVSGAGDGFAVIVEGLGTFKTSECKDVRKEGDVTSYSFPIEARKFSVRSMSIVVDPITKAGPETRQAFTIFDLHFKMSRPFCLYKSMPPRAFVDRDGAEVTNIYETITTAAAEDTKSLPVKGWKPLDSAHTGVSTKVVQMDVGGEKRDCLQITWTKPADKKQRYAVVKVPFAVNALEWNTLSFLYKIETPAGLEKCEGRELSRIPQYFMFDKYIDNPGISFASDRDCYDWNSCGVTRQHLSQGKREAAGTPRGWKLYACDLVNDDPTGNKWFSMGEITSYEISLKNSLLKEGQKVVFTIALPRLTRGLVYRGGDLALYKEFLEWRKSYRPRPYEEALKDNPLDKARLAEPVPVMKDRIARIEIVQTGDKCRNPVGRRYAAKLLREELLRALNPKNDIRITGGNGSAADTTKLFLGIPGNAPKEVKEAVAAFRKECSGTPAVFVMEQGGNFYFAGVTDFDTVGQEKGIMNGVLDFLEGNVGLIWPRYVEGRKIEQPSYDAIRLAETPEDFSFTWGSKWTVKPTMKWWALLNWDERLAFFNRASYCGCWYGDATIEMSSYRAWAANHWFGYGSGDKENDKWGKRADGTRYRPDCYNGTPCLINVMEDGKRAFLSEYLGTKYPAETGWEARYYRRFSDNASPLWIEDTWKTCQCPECMKPFRLPDGTLITKDDPDFKTEAHAVNAMAYNHILRVYLNRSIELHYLVYFYTLPVPRTPVSRFIHAHFCPYVRNSYDLPIYAPCHDKFWRIIAQWAQVSPTMGVSDYYLGGNFRPSADVQAFDIRALRELGVVWFGQETECLDGSVPETWVASRKLYMPDADADAVRAYYCSKVFGRGAKEMYDFYAKLRRLRYDQTYDTEFEETGWSELGREAIAAPSSRRGCANLAEELDKLIQTASRKTSKDAQSHWYVEKVRTFWNWYYANAKKDKPE